MVSQETLAMLSTYGPLVAVMILFYFMLYRPQKAEQQRRKDMLDNLSVGNTVMTVGGIYGTIERIDENVLHLKIADKVVIKVARSAVNTNVSQGSAAKAGVDMHSHEMQDNG